MTQPVDTTIAAEPDGASSADGGASTTQVRVAYWVFVAYLAVALPLLLWIGSYRWFFGDEWSFLADRSVTLDGLFRDHNQHWATLPVLVYRGLYSVFGLHTYFPYQLLIVSLHLTLAALLRVVMRRAGVGAWIATVAAGSFVLLGAAEDNILWAFQIGFVGALILGISQMLFADHDGGLDRRDWIGLVFGAAALMTHGPAVALVFATGLLCVFRGRWVAAVFHTVPLGCLYLVWFTLDDVEPIVGIADRPFTIREYAVWMWDAAVGLFIGLGHWWPIAVLLLAVVPLGFFVAWQREGARPLLRRSALAVAMAVAALAFISLAAPGRFFLGDEPARAGRYIGVLAALTLPLIAIAADGIARRWRLALYPVMVLFLLPLPFNAMQFGSDELLTREFFDAQRNFVGGLPGLPIATEVPPWIEPNNTIVGQPDMTVGWLLQADAEGRLPEGQLDVYQLALLPLQLGVVIDPSEAPDGLRCETYDRPIAADPALGDRWVIRDPIRVGARTGEALPKLWRSVEPPNGEAGVDTHVAITLPDLHLVVAPADGEDQFELCR